ncbi:MAG: tetratricopeptide repeat protein [Calditrichales bacterium]|nr:MAG: tetratricopeptide repeat protein [Calditrichales bacterium]
MALNAKCASRRQKRFQGEKMSNKNLNKITLLISSWLICQLLILTGYSNVLAQTKLNTGIIPTGSFSGNIRLSGVGQHSGVYVFIEGTSQVGVTDAAGNYTIDNVPYGTYTLTAQKENFTLAQLTNQTIQQAGQVVSVAQMVLDPVSETAEYLFSSANVMSSSGDDAGAAIQFQKIINRFPSTTLALHSEYRIAFIDYTEDNFPLAETKFTIFLNNHSQSNLVPPVRYWLGKTKAQLKKYAEAIDVLTTMISQDSTHEKAADAAYTIGTIYETVGDPSNAVLAYRKVVDNYPTHNRAADA